MKRILLFSCFCLSAIIASAQAVSPVLQKKPKQELGIFGQADGLSDDKSLLLVGVQYQRWHNEHLGFRISLAAGAYYATGPELHYISGDTGITKRQHYNINLPVVGFGLQTQRHFYKNIYLFASTELSGGWGTGLADTGVSWAVGQGALSQHMAQNTGRHDASMVYGALNVAIGGKVERRRVSIGLEVSPIHMTYTQLDDGRTNAGNADFTIGSFSHRVFLNWRL
jgi:hypothetical protein